MGNFLFSLNVTLPIFIIILVGGFLKRIGLLNEGFTSVADKFVFKVALPVQLFRDIAAMDIRADFSGKFVVFCGSKRFRSDFGHCVCRKYIWLLGHDAHDDRGCGTAV